MAARGPGRPRSESAAHAALAATEAILRERGYAALTMTEVAARAGIGKQTLYRRWASKHALVAECVLSGMLPFDAVIPIVTGDVEADLRAWWGRSIAVLADPEKRAIFQALSTAAASDSEAAMRIRTQVSAPIEAGLREVLESGRSAGTVRSEVVPAAAAQLLLGALMFALLDRPAHDTRAAVVDTLLHGVLVDPHLPARPPSDAREHDTLG